MRGFVFVSTPYRRFPAGRQEAAEEACRASAVLAEAGIPHFCPIAHSHHIAALGGLNPDGDLWPALNLPLLKAAKALLVVMLEGWDTSEGVLDEVEKAESFGTPIFYAYKGRVPEALVAVMREEATKDEPLQTAGDFCRRAIHLVDQDREQEYGDRHDSLNAIAEHWDTYITSRRGKTITGADVAAMMGLLKLSRFGANQEHSDSIVDAIGYIGLAGEMVARWGQ